MLQGWYLLISMEKYALNVPKLGYLLLVFKCPFRGGSIFRQCKSRSKVDSSYLNERRGYLVREATSWARELWDRVTSSFPPRALPPVSRLVPVHCWFDREGVKWPCMRGASARTVRKIDMCS